MERRQILEQRLSELAHEWPGQWATAAVKERAEILAQLQEIDHGKVIATPVPKIQGSKERP